MWVIPPVEFLKKVSNFLCMEEVGGEGGGCCAVAPDAPSGSFGAEFLLLCAYRVYITKWYNNVPVIKPAQ